MMSKLSSLIFAFTILAPALSSAAVPRTVSFSARVADNGRPLTGGHSFTFAFWDCDGTDTGSCFAPDHVVWTEAQTLTVNDGVVTAVLGADSVTPNLFPPALFNGSARWFAVTMDGTAFGPLMAVHSVPYAFRAGAAEDVQCSGPCVQDSEIESVSWSKVTGIPTTSVAPNFTYTSPQTRYLTLPGGPCAHPAGYTGTLQADNMFWCDLTDGVTNTSGSWPVFLPNGATIVGFQVRAWASGTVTCTLRYGLDGWTSYDLATSSKSGPNWTISPEVTLSHAVVNGYGYAVYCVASGTASDQGVGSIRIRYTVPGP